MAIIIATRVQRGSGDEYNQLWDRIEEEIMKRGAPPDGLMVHIGHPEGDGFVIQAVWRSEDTMRAFHDSVVFPALDDLGLDHDEPQIAPVWSLARP